MRVQELEAALKPFAEYATLPGFDKLPNDMIITVGSSLAAKQLTVLDCKEAAKVLGYKNG